jgi:integrase
MMVKDERKLVPVKNNPGIYRRHNPVKCKGGRCDCPYIVRWKEHGQSRKQLFSSFEEAREHKRTIGPGQASRKPLSKETVADYYEAWVDDYRGRTKRGVQASTVREYRISFKHHILTRPIAKIRLRDLTAPDVGDWMNELERRGASPATIKRARIALRVMLACAVQRGEITANPITDVRYIPTEAAKARHAKPAPKQLGATDIRAIMQAVPESWRAFFFTLAQTGMRVGEALGLTWGNVHLGDDPFIMVVEQVYRGERKRLKTEGSTGKVPLSPFIASWLSELRPRDVAPSSPVFTSTAGTPLGYSNLYNRVLRPALVKAGIAVQVGEDKKGRPVYDYQRVGFHAFRHACATLLHGMEKRPAQAQAWLRHSQLMTTMNTYTHMDDEGLGGAEAFDEILGADTLRESAA